MVNYESFIDVNKAAKQCKKIGEFIMFTALHGDRVNMLKTSYECKRAGDMVVVDDCHVLSVIKDEIWQENEYLQKGRDIL